MPSCSRTRRGGWSGTYLPGSNAINFLLQGALDGGCTVSLRFDPFGKSAAQDALDMAIPVPSGLLG